MMSSLYVGTRLHGKNILSDDPSLTKLESFLRSASTYAGHIGIAVDATQPQLLESVRALIVCHASAKISVLPVQWWNGFTPALNTLTAHAASIFKAEDARILFQSVEVNVSPSAIQQLTRLSTPSTLVCGAALDGHDFQGSGTATLDGATCVWNTLALWSIKKLSRTGFLPISDGNLVGVDGGVEEVACVAAQQRMFPGTAEAVLVRLSESAGISWGTSFTGPDRKAWHARKMASKRTRAASQLRALGWEQSAGIVRHVDVGEDRDLDAELSAARGYIEPIESFRNATVLLTGGAGFIGSHTAEQMLRRGNSVVIIDNFNNYYDVQQKEDNIAHLEGVLAQCANSSASLRVIEGDICNKDLMQRIFAEHRPELVVHLAARAGVRPSLEDPHLYVQANLAGTTVLLENSRLFGVKHFVYASSSSVYGGSTEPTFSERQAVDAPVSPYAATKKATELMASTFTHLYGLPTSGLRFFTVYGPRGRPDMAPYKFIKRAVQGDAIDQYGDGSSERDYTYVADIVDGVLRTLDRPSGCQVYNLGRGTPITLKKFIGLVADLSAARLTINYLPDQPGDVKRTCADISKARDLLGYAPKTAFATGLANTFKWFMARRARTEQLQLDSSTLSMDKLGLYAPADGLSSPASSRSSWSLSS